ncbi:MAG: type II toxin-antitoxin system RelE/ParE family toxin [Treponema sp.]
MRKIRWGKKDLGKSGGIRIIYFIKTNEKIYLLFAYAKTEADNLTMKQIRELKVLTKEL